MMGRFSRRTLLGKAGLTGAGASVAALLPAGMARAVAPTDQPFLSGAVPDVAITSLNVGVTAANYVSIHPYTLSVPNASGVSLGVLANGSVYAVTPTDFLFAPLVLPPGAQITSLSAWGLDPGSTGANLTVDIIGRLVDGPAPDEILASAVPATGTLTTGGLKKATATLNPPVTYNGASAVYAVRVINTNSVGPKGIHSISVGYDVPTTILLPAPVRVYDSRTAPEGRLTPGAERLLPQIGAIPQSRFPATTGAFAKAVIMTLTLADTIGSGYITAYSSDEPSPPLASNSNWYATNQVVANTVITRVGVSSGAIKVVTGGGGSATHIVIDVLGFIF